MYMRCVLLVYLLCILISLSHIFTVIVQAQHTIDHARVHLDKRLLLLAREATEAVEALALTIAIVKATVRALSKFGDSADVRRGASSCDSLNDFGFQAAGDGGRADHAIRHGERTTITSGTSGNTLMRSGDDFEEELHAGLPRPVIERDKEIHTFSSSDVHTGGTEAVASVGCAVAAVGRDVLGTISYAFASCVAGTSGYRVHIDTLEHFVRERLERALHARRDNCVVARCRDAVSAPHAAIRIVVDDEELVIGSDTASGGRVRGRTTCGCRPDLDGLLHHSRLDGGQRVVALRRDAAGTVRTRVAEVALAALDLLGVPQLVEEAGEVARVVRVGHVVRQGDTSIGLEIGVPAVVRRAAAAVVEVDG